MNKKYAAFICVVVMFILNITGCTTPKKDLPLIKLKPSAYPEFSDDIVYDGLEHSINQSLSYLRLIPEDRKFVFGEDTFNTVHMIQTLEHFLKFVQTKPSGNALKEFIKSNYLVYQSMGRDQEGEVLFTGYFEPLMQGTVQRNEEYRFPVYGPPDDLSVVDLSLFSSKFEGEKIIGRVMGKTFVPYYERKEIEEDGVLAGKAEPLAWVKDRVELFFLHIQGSGKISLDNGKIINVHYYGKNGLPYKSIGQLLIDEGKISKEEMSMQKIREYLMNHPEETGQILNHNPSYIFFSIEEDGPLGALNVKLTPGRSIAVDKSIFPMAGLSFIETQKPLVDGSGAILSWTGCSRFVLNQDTGGAIRGAGRADLFWGNGTYAEIAAGHMKHRGRLYLLILKPGVS